MTTTDLKQELDALASSVPAYDVLDGAIALHRRRRGRRMVGAAAVAVLVVLGLTAGPGLISTRAEGIPAAQPDDPGSLPRTLTFAKVWTPEPQDDPAGPAALVFAGDNTPFDGDFGSATAGFVGLRDDTYRLMREGSTTGEGTLLSPDGALVAYCTDSGGLRVLDLRTGEVRAVASRPGTGSTVPVAWSPDGRTLLVATVDHLTTTQKYVYTQLGLVEVATGAYLELPGADNVDNGPRAFMGAFSADGSKVAYQVYDQINIASRSGKFLSALFVDKGQRIAGKGAWTPDGTALAVVDRRHCCDATPSSSATTEVHLRAISGGQEIVGRFGAVPGARMIQVQGWAPDGSLVAVAAYDTPRRFADGFPYTGLETDIIGRVEVVALRRDAPPRVLLAPQQRIFTIDIAQSVIAGGRSRPGSDAPTWPVQGGYLKAALIVISVPLLILSLFGWAIVRIVRRIRRRSPVR